jgi:phosphatidylglycerol:prolipoprotein diacylglycerol transferase
VTRLFEYPEFDPIAFAIGPIAVRWYGLMYLGAFLAAWLGMRARAKQPWRTVRRERVDDLVFYSALGVIVGGRIGYMLVYGRDELFADPLSLFKIWEGGMSFHGGLAGVLIAMGIYARCVGVKFFDVMDEIAPWVPIGLGLGRIGNFINGELWGKEASPDAPWAIIYRGVPRHPSQLYEAVLEGLLLFLILWSFTLRPRPRMAASALFLLGYGVFRILVEFVRVPDEDLGYIAFGWLTTGQLLSIPLVLAGIVLLVLAYRHAPPTEQRRSAASTRAA